MGISSADLAGVSAGDANRKADDQAVLIEWLIARIGAIEELLAVIPPERPELPSERFQRLTYERDKRAADEFWGRSRP